MKHDTREQNIMQKIDYILLLGKQLGGELDPAEAARLDEWLRQSPENERMAADVRRAWDQAGGFNPTFSPDLAAGFARVQAKIRAEQPRPTVLYLGARGRQFLRVAAALAFLLAAVWAFRAFGPPATATRVEMAQHEAKRAVQLPDGSQVWLRQGARIEFPEKFTAAERRVALEGEAYFDVAHRPGQAFRVETPGGGLVEVLGTQFGVCAPDNNRTSVLVRSGKVRFSPDGRQEGTFLTAGKKAVYDRAAAEITVTEPTSFNELAWQSGGLEFINTPLNQVIADLEVWYGVDIELRNPAMATCGHTAPLTDQPIEQVLNALATPYGMKLSKSASGQYLLSGGECR